MLVPTRDEGPQAPNRAQRRRASTRAKLLEAGRVVFAEKGVDAATIQDITEAADVGRGSFYNFFSTKEELAEEIAREVDEALIRVEEQVNRVVSDPALALATILRLGAAATNRNPALAWFTLNRRLVGGEVFTKFEQVISALIDRGRKAGQFDVEDTRLAYTLLAGMLTAGLEARLIGRLPPDSSDRIIEHALRFLGLDHATARKFMAADLPVIETAP